MTTLLEEKEKEATPAPDGGQIRNLAGEARGMIRLSPSLVAYNLGYLALAWAVAIGAIALFWAVPAWYTFAFAFLVVSSRHQALLNCEHEAGHGKLLPGRRWNEVVGRWFCAGPVGSPYEAARARHLSHHRLLTTAEDPDHDLHSGPDKRTRSGLAKHFIGALFGGYAGMVLMGPPTGQPVSKSAKRQDMLAVAAAQLAIAAGLTLAFDWWVYLALWLAPLGTTTVFLHLLRSFIEHAITEEEEASAHSNRLITIASNPIERGLVAPFNMNYHAEHHLLPSVPAPRLKELQARLTENAETPPLLTRSSYGSALVRYVRALRV